MGRRNVADEKPLNEEPERIPYAKLMGLSATAFVAILTETVVSGFLQEVATSLGTTVSLVGHYLTSYAVGSAIGAIPIMTATRHLPRRPLLVPAVMVLSSSNFLTAINSNSLVGLAIRFFAGMSGGVAWGLLTNQARGIVPREF